MGKEMGMGGAFGRVESRAWSPLNQTIPLESTPRDRPVNARTVEATVEEDLVAVAGEEEVHHLGEVQGQRRGGPVSIWIRMVVVWFRSLGGDDVMRVAAVDSIDPRSVHTNTSTHGRTHASTYHWALGSRKREQGRMT